jgi:2-dehydropantoate 2-reductase
VIVTCKSYDLDSAIESIAPAVGASTCVLPLLNGVAHVDRLAAAFGAARVAAGACAIPATLAADGEIVHLGTFHSIVFGRLAATAADAQPRLEALRDLYAKTPVPVEIASDMMTALWEKFVGLATLAAMTCLMRAPIGDIVSTDDGEALVAEAFEACLRTAAAEGHPPRDAAVQRFRAMLADRSSTLTASMLRDLEAGGRTEGAHIVGDMLRRARAAGDRSRAPRRRVVPPAGGRAHPRTRTPRLGAGIRAQRHVLNACICCTARDSVPSSAHAGRQSRQAPGGRFARRRGGNSSNDIAGSDTLSEARGSSTAVHARTLTPMQQHDRSPARGEGLRALVRGARALGSAAIVAGALHASPCAAQAADHLRIVGASARSTSTRGTKSRSGRS